MAVRTPWGMSDYSQDVGRGIKFFGTPGHGGYRILKDKYVEACEKRGIPPHVDDYYVRGNHLWFEEDCDWAFLAIAFPEEFEKNLASAEKTLRNTYPDYWEKWQGRELQKGESEKKDEIIFFEEHKNDWLAVDACRMECNPTTFIVTAKQGGDKGADKELRQYIVPKERYADDDRPYWQPYEVGPGDRQITRDELEELSRSCKDMARENEDDFHVINIRQDKENPAHTILVCKRLGSGDYLEGVGIIETSIPTAEWEERDITVPHIVKKDSSGEWQLEELGPELEGPGY